jgi:transposase-like protein
MKQEAATGTESKRRRTRVYSAKEKAEALLALWSGRRSISALMKELEAPWAILNGWEKRALTGMLSALDPTWKKSAEGQPTLPARLEKLIEQTVNPTAAAQPPAAN